MKHADVYCQANPSDHSCPDFDSFAIFLLLRLIPGDPALLLAGPEGTDQQVEQLRRAMGLDRPIWVQYGIWVSRVLQGDLGTLFINDYHVAKLMLRKLPATIELSVATIIVAGIIAFPTGLLAAVRERSRFDMAVTTYNSLALVIPTFWLGILLVIFFGLRLKWLPTSGRGPLLDAPVKALRFLILPAFMLGSSISAVLSRFLKAAMLEVLNQDYIRTARAKGLRDRLVVARHALKNALIPVLTILGLQLGALMGGAVVTEAIFDWPGVGG